jgi:hypothetical protein
VRDEIGSEREKQGKFWRFGAKAGPENWFGYEADSRLIKVIQGGFFILSAFAKAWA